jgi:hypothetical protein
MQMRQRFQSRTALMDEKIGSFLKIVTELGGYCTLEQAKALEVANSDTRVLAYLRGLERAGFVRRVADYPVVYQITGATTRLLDRDRRARRTHDTARVLSRLLAVSFYLEARLWPADFAFDHQRKIDTFVYEGCPIEALPQRGGKPYLWEELVLWHDYNRIGVAIMDDQQRSPLSQLKGFARGFSRLVACLGERLRMLIVTGTESRHLIYCRLVHHPAVMKLSPPGFAIAIEPYQMRSAAKSLQLLPRGNSEEFVVSQPEPQQARRRTSQYATPATTMTAIIRKAVTQPSVTSGTVPLVTLVPSEAEHKFPDERLRSQKTRHIQDRPLRRSDSRD